MIPFWFLFSLPTFGALLSRPLSDKRRSSSLAWVAFGLFLTLMIGFRYRVGGDWGFENVGFHFAQGLGLSQVAKRYDPGFAFLIWLFAETGYNVWTLNLASGAIFTWGLITFCRSQPLPWLCVTVAIPYLVVVVAMGYSRQSVAIGFALFALTALGRQSIIRFLIFMALAASVHITATLLVPIGILASRKQKLKSLFVGVPISILLFVFLLQDNVDLYVNSYLVAKYQSQGAMIRVAMNALPACLFLISRNRFGFDHNEKRLWTIIALIAILFVLLLYLSPSSTAVDRMALYFIPIQLVILGRLPIAWSRAGQNYKIILIGVVLYSAVVLFIWLNFSTHSQYWLPYQLFPMDELDFRA